jgi:hypothetical protein
MRAAPGAWPPPKNNWPGAWNVEELTYRISQWWSAADLPSVFHFQKVLGHSGLEVTRRYANLMTEDLQAVHQKISLLAA